MQYPYVNLGFFNYVSNFSTYVSKSHEVNCQRVISFDASATADPVPIDVLKSYDDIEGTTLFLFPVLKKKIVVFIFFLFMVFVFSFRNIFIFSLIVTFRFSVFIVKSILIVFSYC